jgi:hypothetical protein
MTVYQTPCYGYQNPILLENSQYLPLFQLEHLASLVSMQVSSLGEKRICFEGTKREREIC